jgi:hypothetical protein
MKPLDIDKLESIPEPVKEYLKRRDREVRIYYRDRAVQELSLFRDELCKVLPYVRMIKRDFNLEGLPPEIVEFVCLIYTVIGLDWFRTRQLKGILPIKRNPRYIVCSLGRLKKLGYVTRDGHRWKLTGKTESLLKSITTRLTNYIKLVEDAQNRFKGLEAIAE